MAMPMIDECHSPSFKDKLKSMISHFTCRNDDIESSGGAGFHRSEAATARYQCSWLKLAATEDLQVMDECLGIIGKRGKKTGRRYNSVDFRYDLAGYSLNFADEINRKDEMPMYWSFASRLLATPDRPPIVSLQPRDELNVWL